MDIMDFKWITTFILLIFSGREAFSKKSKLFSQLKKQTTFSEHAKISIFHYGSSKINQKRFEKFAEWYRITPKVTFHMNYHKLYSQWDKNYFLVPSKACNEAFHVNVSKLHADYNHFNTKRMVICYSFYRGWK